MLLLLNAWNPNLRTGPVPPDSGGGRPPSQGHPPRGAQFVDDMRYPQLEIPPREPEMVVDDDDWLVLL